MSMIMMFYFGEKDFRIRHQNSKSLGKKNVIYKIKKNNV